MRRPAAGPGWTALATLAPDRLVVPLCGCRREWGVLDRRALAWVGVGLLAGAVGGALAGLLRAPAPTRGPGS